MVSFCDGLFTSIHLILLWPGTVRAERGVVFSQTQTYPYSILKVAQSMSPMSHQMVE